MIRCGCMAEHDWSNGGDPKTEADRTLRGVAPPSLESAPESLVRSPVFVRAGTTAADAELPPISQTALPPPRPLAQADASEPTRGPGDASQRERPQSPRRSSFGLR